MKRVIKKEKIVIIAPFIECIKELEKYKVNLDTANLERYINNNNETTHYKLTINTCDMSEWFEKD